MIEAVRKRYKVGDTITIHTSEASFTGKLDAFEDTCVILVTEEGEEFIANEDVKRVSVPKQNFSNINQITVISPAIEVEPEVEIVKEESIKTETMQQVIEAKPLIPQYKVGDKIPLDILDKRIDKKILINKVKPPKIKGKATLTLGSLSDLRQLILPELEAENKITVPANGTIKSYASDRGFGFILDKNGYEIFFGYSSIIDQQLYDSLKGQNRYANIPVLFSIGKNKKGGKALFIHKPKSVEQVVLLARKYVEEGDQETATALLDQVLVSFPDNYTVMRLREEIKAYLLKTKNHYAGKSLYKPYDPNYQKATKAKNIDKNFEEAVKYYMLALQNNEKRESCIKDIAMLYISMGEIEKALEFIGKYEPELPNNITTYNYLENFYSSAKEFEKVLEYIDLLLEERTVTHDKRKRSMYLSKKGFALIQLNELDEAREVLEEAVSIHRENTYPNRLLDALNNPDKNELQNIIDESEFNNYGGGLSKIIRNSLENCSFKGLKDNSREEGLANGFSKSHLNEVRRYITDAGSGRPIDRANALLTEAKLIETIEPNNEKDFYSVLARHCNAKALAYISSREHLDVARYYYLEAFGIEDNWDSVARQAGLYIWSLKANYSDLLAGNPPTFDELFNDIVSDDKDVIWHSIVSLLLSNNSIAAKLVERLFSNKIIREKSINFIRNQGTSYTQIKNIEEYTALWNEVLEKRRLDTNHWFASIISLSKSNSIDILASQFSKVSEDLKKPWLNQLDLTRLREVLGVVDKINDYLRKTLFDDQENEARTTRQLIDSIISEIIEKPTKFSYEGFIPLLTKIDSLLEKSFTKVLEISTPKVRIKILSEDSPVERINYVPFQISISNAPESSPILDTKISIIENDEIKFADGDTQHFDSIKGGKDWIFKLTVQVSDKIIRDKAATLYVACEYKIRNQEDPITIQEQLSLRLYSEEEFEVIENPYAPIADGGPVENKKMFFGRDEFIKNRITAIINADSKQIIIYGQKRSGKSSVLYHLKKGLEETNRTFCVSFSLGIIIKDLNEFTFYHKILSTIERELKLRKAKGEIVPVFICPSLEEFKLRYHTNPANGFIELIEDFKIATLQVEGWVEKKLIIMIDEFTYLYTAIRSGTTSETIMKQWKAVTQSENAKLSVVLVGQDVVPSFKQEDYAKNAFGVIEDIRLTYLEEIDARRLIVEPILDRNDNSRFIGRAVDTIIDYTSRNPYYIQIFCARLVDYMNAKKVIRVTEADIKEVAQTFIEGSQALAPEKFDNLIRAGEEHDFKEFDDEPIIKILRQIAIGSKNIGICSRDNISLNDKVMEDRILKHLTDREVLERKQGDNFKIQVKLFQEWLLRH